MKRLVDFKDKTSKKIEELESELIDLKVMLELVNSLLLEKGFKRAEIAKTSEDKETLKQAATGPEPCTEYEAVSQLKTADGEILADLYTSDNSLRAVLSKARNFNVNTPPFASFLVERVLAKMQDKDCELARAGQLPSGEIFSYEIIRDGDFVREIVVRHVDEDRLRELKSSIRWTLEKMHEKVS
jgi:hypothetical protein